MHTQGFTKCGAFKTKVKWHFKIKNIAPNICIMLLSEYLYIQKALSNQADLAIESFSRFQGVCLKLVTATLLNEIQILNFDILASLLPCSCRAMRWKIINIFRNRTVQQNMFFNAQWCRRCSMLLIEFAFIIAEFGKQWTGFEFEVDGKRQVSK